MSNVIQFNKKEEDDNRGYIMDEDLSAKEVVSGVYVENIAAMVQFDNVYLGTKGDGQIDDALLTNKKDMNDFCLMWLAIFNSDALKYDEE